MKHVFLVTGASSDVGLCFLGALERECAARREQCVVFGQYHHHGKELGRMASGFKGVDLRPVQCDLREFSGAEHMIEEARKSGLFVTHMLHLAAPRFEYMRIKRLEWERIREGFHIQVCSFARLLEAFLPEMAARKYGRVVAMLTAYTLGKPPKFMCDYLMEKYALWGLIKAAAAEYSGGGVTVNAVSPNMMETKFLGNLDSRSIEMNARGCSMKRNADVKEVCSAIRFLMSDEASYITGVNFNVSGGDYM